MQNDKPVRLRRRFGEGAPQSFAGPSPAGRPVAPGLPHFMFCPRLLRTFNIVLKKCSPLHVLLPPLLRNPDDGPVHSLPGKTLWFFPHGFNRTKQAVQNICSCLKARLVRHLLAQTVAIIVALRRYLQPSSSHMRHRQFVIDAEPLQWKPLNRASRE